MEAGEEYRSCAVCARTLLRGEQPAEYLDGDGTPAIVCSLCKPRAEAAGWVPAALAGATAGAGSQRRSRINLRERFDRISRLATARTNEAREAAEQPYERFEDELPPALARPVAEPLPAPAPEARPAAPAPPADPLEVFNSSEQARTVAGLTRSLGDPQVSVREEGDRTLVTVAWELSWYRWEVEGNGVREVAKGGELDELDEADREWNARAVEGGGVRRGGA